MSTFEAFNKKQYLSIETFRKSGAGVKTPVWFVQDGDTLYVRTGADSGKVKRIRKNARVNIAPCKMDGTLLGEWQPAQARVVSDPETDKRVDRLLDKKYGLLKKLFLRSSDRRKMDYALLEIKDSKS